MGVNLVSHEHRLRVFKNRELRRIFEPTMEEVTGEWTNLHNMNFMICIHQIFR
jgi:hypothetical protein